jgi:hypothetical protein
MHQYDSTLKLLLQASAPATLRALTGTAVKRWLNVELPKVQNPRIDLLGETADRGLIHIELQSTNDRQMPLRMAEYYLAIYRRYRRFARQIVVYVGNRKLSMASKLSGPAGHFSYDLVDLRDLDNSSLLASRAVSDNVIGLLGRPAGAEALRRVLGRIARMEPAQRVFYLRSLFAVAGLRGWESVVEREAKSVPVVIDIMANKVLGRERRKGIEQGLERGLERGMKKGLSEGQLKGELTILRRQLEKKFGPIPAWADERLSKATVPEIEELAVRLLDAATLDELLKS